MQDAPDPRQDALIRAAIVRLRTGIMALVFAMFGGTGLFLATAWLLVRGGERVGQHLGLLAHFFPGYSVTWPGCFVGLAYGALVGALGGAALAWVYNTVALRRVRP